MPSEPLTTALALLAFGVLMAVSVLFSRATEWLRLPVALVFLLIGMLAGSEGIGGLEFENYAFTFRWGTVALVLILFDGGLNTPLASLRQAWRPAAMLATLGVLGTAALVALGARALGFPWSQAALLGAVVSSTDAAATFAVLRSSGLNLKRRVAVTLELESGANDPAAVILTIAVTGAIVQGGTLGWPVLADMLVQLAIGVIGGIAIGHGGRLLVRAARLPAGGMYPVLSIAIASLAFAVPTLMLGSGFMAVYIAGMILGNGPIPYRSGLLRVHDALAWLAQVFMFVLLGLLAFPSRLLDVAAVGLALALFLAVVARPAVVLFLLAPFRYPWREKVYIAWMGLRGAVPIVLATYPVMAGAEGARHVFDVVFFVVVVSALVPGGTVTWVTRRLGLQAPEPVRPQAVLELSSTQPLDAEILSFYIEPESAVAGSRIADLPFPEGAAVTLIVRGTELLPAKGGTVLQPGDHVFVFCRREDLGYVQLLFGRLEQDESEPPSEDAGEAGTAQPS